jgi:hypothetical protein
MKRGGRPDATQAAIVEGLRAAGYSVAITTKVGFGYPDLCVGGKNAHGVPTNWLLEVKSPGGKPNDSQREFHSDWRGQVATVESLDEALEVCGAALSAVQQKP